MSDKLKLTGVSVKAQLIGESWMLDVTAERSEEDNPIMQWRSFSFDLTGGQPIDSVALVIAAVMRKMEGDEFPKGELVGKSLQDVLGLKKRKASKSGH